MATYDSNQFQTDMMWWIQQQKQKIHRTREQAYIIATTFTDLYLYTSNGGSKSKGLI